MFAASTWCALLLAGLLTACAAPPLAPRNMPLLQLQPSALGGTLALHQQLTVEVRGQARQLEVLVEADAALVRVALLSLGQTVATLTWDGQTMQETRAAWWPTEVRAANILSDLQLVWWPVEAVRAGLPAGWDLRTETDLRELRDSGAVVTVVRTLSPTRVELSNLRSGYRLRIESVTLN
jgi:hypothetical protein